MMRYPALLLLGLLAANLHAQSWTPSQDMLSAVRRLESADGRFTVGDAGRSLGNYQISEAAWCDVSAWRKTRGLPIFDYETRVWSESVSRAYAANYLTILRVQLKKRLQRPPSAAELYSAYNMGMTSFAKRNYRPTAAKAGKLQEVQTDLAGQ